MAICDDYGIPHSEFLAWDEDDQDLAIAYRIYKAEHCSQCGTAEEEWKKDNFAYHPEVRRCRGCEVRGLQEEIVQKDLEAAKGSTHGLRVVLVPKK